MRHILQSFTTLICLLSAVSFCSAQPTEDEGLYSHTLCEAAALLPDWLEGEVALSTTAHFLVAHDAGVSEAEALADILEGAFKQFQLFFKESGFVLNRPVHRLSWISFSDPDRFRQYVRRAERVDVSRLSGYFSARTNRVVIVDRPMPVTDAASHEKMQVPASHEIAPITDGSHPNLLVKIAHELAHQLAFNTGLQKRGVMYPLWISEGLATQYETRLSYCQQSNTARSERLAEMYRGDRLIPLDRFISLSRLSADRQQCEDIYAQSWGFFRYLLQSHPEALQNYLQELYNVKQGFRSIESVNREFTNHFGPIDQFDRAWMEFLRTQ